MEFLQVCDVVEGRVWDHLYTYRFHHIPTTKSKSQPDMKAITVLMKSMNIYSAVF